MIPPQPSEFRYLSRSSAGRTSESGRVSYGSRPYTAGADASAIRAQRTSSSLAYRYPSNFSRVSSTSESAQVRNTPTAYDGGDYIGRELDEAQFGQEVTSGHGSQGSTRGIEDTILSARRREPALTTEVLAAERARIRAAFQKKHSDAASIWDKEKKELEKKVGVLEQDLQEARVEIRKRDKLTIEFSAMRVRFRDLERLLVREQEKCSELERIVQSISPQAAAKTRGARESADRVNHSFTSVQGRPSTGNSAWSHPRVSEGGANISRKSNVRAAAAAAFVIDNHQ